MIVRHGESAGNVSRRAAEAAGLAMLDLVWRDADTPLSELGEHQAMALGRWLGQQPEDQRPTAVFVSPYVRARQTADLLLKESRLDDDDLCVVIDERLREKEFGILDRLTLAGIQQHFPEQAEFRRHLGKFYHRPPGGESWCDVILRLRSLADTLCRDFRRERVLIVTHQVVVLCLRYLLECMTEEQILEIDRREAIANCSLTTYDYDPSARNRGKMALKTFNFVAPLEEAGEPVTTTPDTPVAPK